MSSPRQNTFWSRSISSNSASRIASRYVTSDIVSPPARWALVNVNGRLDPLTEPERRNLRRIRVDPNQRVPRIGHWRCFGLIGRAVDFLLHSGVDARQFRLFEFLVQQALHVTIDRIVLSRPAIDLARRYVR